MPPSLLIAYARRKALTLSIHQPGFTHRMENGILNLLSLPRSSHASRAGIMELVRQYLLQFLWYSFLDCTGDLAVTGGVALGACGAGIVDSIGDVLFNALRELLLGFGGDGRAADGMGLICHIALEIRSFGGTGDLRCDVEMVNMGGEEEISGLSINWKKAQQAAK